MASLVTKSELFGEVKIVPPIETKIIAMYKTKFITYKIA